jgi:hypothetical protein
MLYAEIKIAGKLDPQWSDWFEGLEIKTQGSNGTILCGFLPDQSAVFGMLSRLASLGMTLESVTVTDPDKNG